MTIQLYLMFKKAVNSLWTQHLNLIENSVGNEEDKIIETSEVSN